MTKSIAPQRRWHCLLSNIERVCLTFFAPQTIMLFVMRVIAGKFRGLKIPSPKEEIVKPTLDRVKENLFNILQFDVANSVCLDLFCGSGALGIECISRGAKEVCFVDVNRQNTMALEKFLNLHKMPNFSIFNCDFFDAIKLFESKQKKFNIIFVDPPFDSNLAEVAIKKILHFGLLEENGVVVWEHSTQTQVPKAFEQKIEKSKKYGTVQLEFIKLQPKI